MNFFSSLAKILHNYVKYNDKREKHLKFSKKKFFVFFGNLMVSESKLVKKSDT